MIAMPSHRRPARPPRGALALAILALSLGLAACAPGASGTPSATAPATNTITPATPPNAPQPTPLPTGSFTTYTNTAYGYSIAYPRDWSVEGADATAPSFIVFNYDPQTYQQPTSAPPLLKIELDAVPDLNTTPALDLFKQTLSGPGQPPATITSAQATPLANDTATLIVWTSAASQYPTITYILIPRHATTALFTSQSNAAGGQPSPVFTQMLASLIIRG
jgi:hypothetical protein